MNGPQDRAPRVAKAARIVAHGEERPGVHGRMAPSVHPSMTPAWLYVVVTSSGPRTPRDRALDRRALRRAAQHGVGVLRVERQPERGAADPDADRERTQKNGRREGAPSRAPREGDELLSRRERDQRLQRERELELIPSVHRERPQPGRSSPATRGT